MKQEKHSWKLDISDEDLLVMSKYFTLTMLGEKFGVSCAAISQKMIRIKRNLAIERVRLFGNEKKDTITISPKTTSIKDLIELITSTLLQEKEKTLSTREVIQVTNALRQLATAKAEILGKVIFGEEAIEQIIDILKGIFKSIDPKLQREFSRKVLGNEKLRWLLGQGEPEILEEEKIKIKKAITGDVKFDEILK